MLSLYTVIHHHTKDAHRLDKRVRELLKPVFIAYVKTGHNPREVIQVMCEAITDLESSVVLK